MAGFLKNLFTGKAEKESEEQRKKKQEAAWEEKTELSETAEICYRKGISEKGRSGARTAVSGACFHSVQQFRSGI